MTPTKPPQNCSCKFLFKQLQPFKPSVRNAVVPRPTVGYEPVCGSWSVGREGLHRITAVMRSPDDTMVVPSRESGGRWDRCRLVVSTNTTLPFAYKTGWLSL